MQTGTLIINLLFLGIAFNCLTMALTKEKQDLSAAAASGCRAFSSSFHKSIAQSTVGNIVNSPLSVHVLLSYLFHGSDGSTTQEIMSGLGLSDAENLHEAYKDIMSLLNSVESVELTLANVLFLQDGLQLLETFETIGREYYNFSLENVDFKKKDSTIKLINSWVSKNTNNKINNILSSDDIDEYTKLILVNAIYFKGRWQHEFRATATHKRLFHATNSLSKEVFTMYKEFKFAHGEIPSLNSRFLEIPYMDPNLDMIIVLPNEIEGLKYLEENFDWNVIVNAERSKRLTNLYLPKFKVESTLDLKKVLREIGFKVMFEDGANFTKISEVPLKVDKVIQKAFLEVNEIGSEAAAATVVKMVVKRSLISLEPPDEFIVDRPFIVVIRHVTHNIPLFISSVRDIEVAAPDKDEL